MKRIKSLVIAALVVVATLSAAYTPVSAQSSAALSIVPKKNYTVEPGKTVKDTLVIRNLDDQKTLELTLRVVDFTFIDDGGSPKLMLEEDAPQTTWSLKPFLKIPQTVKIPPKASKTLDMSVTIPAKHGAGSYYSAIVYSTGAPDGGNVGLSASGVTLVFASVPGTVNENLKLEKFGAYNGTQGKDGYMFVTAEKPERMAYTLKNNGNVTQSPVGSITLKHMFGQKQVITDINPNESLALIGQSRTFISCIKLKSESVDLEGSKSRTKACTSPSLWPGRYSADLNIFYGQNGNRTQEIVGSASFWYMPLWFIIVLAILAVAIAYVIWRVVGKVRGKSGPKTKKSSRRKW